MDCLVHYRNRYPSQPYKFNGLSGLTVKVKDLTQTPQFTLVGVSALKNLFSDPVRSNSKVTLNINYENYVTLFRNYREDPLKSFRGRYPDQHYPDGSFKTGAEEFRDEEKLFKEGKKDNNIIEIDLLEQ